MRKILKGLVVGDKWVALLSLLAALFGAFCVLNAGYPKAMSRGEGLLSSEFQKHVMWLIGSGLIYLFISHISVKKLTGFGVWLFVFAFVGAILVLIPGIGVSVNGSSRWLGIGEYTIQPGEILKPAAILFLAFVVTKSYKPIVRRWRDYIEWLDFRVVPWVIRSFPFLLVFAAVILIEVEPDLGTAMMVASAAFGVLIFSRTSGKVLLVIIVVAISLVAMASMKGYRHDRLINHGNRWAPGIVDGPGFQTSHSELAMAYGGVFGVGVGQGRAKHVLPAATTDFVFTTVSEELGLVGSFLVLFLLGGLSFRLIYLASRASTEWSRAVIGATGWWIGTQTAFNLLMAGGGIAPVGIPLPFISYGGSSLFALAIGLGVSQAALRAVPVMEGANETRRNGRRYRRPRLSGA